MPQVSITVNGAEHALDVEPRELLVYVLRERLGLTGTNVGCDTSCCGACTVLLDGESVKSCTLLGVQADGHEITTIEGLGDERGDAPRPGGVPRAARPPVRLLHSRVRHGDGQSAPRRRRTRREEEIRHALEGNLCRCTGYHNIVRAVQAAAGPWRSDDGDDDHRDRGRPASSARRSSAKRTRPSSPGQAKFVDDMSLPGMVWMAVVRSPYAHARIANVNVDGALAHRGVIAAFSGEELADEWQASLPCAWLPTEDTNQPNHRPLAVDEARYVGDGVAVVIAESRERGTRRSGAGPGRLRPAADRGRRREARSKTAPRSCTKSSAPTAATRGSSRRERSTRSSRRPT